MDTDEFVANRRSNHYVRDESLKKLHDTVAEFIRNTDAGYK